MSQCISGDCENGNGIYVLSNGARYEGAFTSGQPDGKGRLIYKTGDLYDGHFVNGEYHGQGKYTYSDGGNCEGTFFEGNFVKGVMTDPKGGKGTGNFKDDQLFGLGEYKMSNGELYKGNFEDGEFNGQGTYIFTNGDKYVGEFKGHRMHGNGVMYFQKGGTLKGTWIDGEYVSGPSEGTSKGIKFTENSGVLIVKVLINGVPVDMIFDTGASMLNLTPDILLPAFRNGTITENDVLGGGDFVDATGEVNMNVIVNIREVQIGDKTIHNVQAAVANSMDGMNLFGLSGIRELGNIRVDFDNLEILTE